MSIWAGLLLLVLLTLLVFTVVIAGFYLIRTVAWIFTLGRKSARFNPWSR